jgi:hypothetical protein
MNATTRILALLLLLAYAGQSVVVVSAPCQMMSGPVSGMEHDMTAMDHAGHAMPSAGEAPPMDCCEGGYCSASHCQMVPGMPSPFPPASVDLNIVLAAATTVSAALSLPESLYRPPTCV